MIYDANFVGSVILAISLYVLSLTFFASYVKNKIKVGLCVGILLFQWALYRSYWAVYWFNDALDNQWIINTWFLTPFIWLMAISAVWTTKELFKKNFSNRRMN